jgi:hypothetical protein
MEVADQRGYGVSDRIIINGKVAYKKEAVLKWLEDRAKPLQIDERKKATPRPHKNDILLGK